MIEFSFDLPDVVHHLKEIEDKIINLSIRHAANRALKVARQEADSDFKERYGIGKGGNKPDIDKFLEDKKLTLAAVRREKSALILAEHHPMSLIHHVMGPKKEQNIKGVPLHKRRKVFVNVGRVSHLKKSFINRPKKIKGGTQVFSWGNYKGTDRLIKQTMPHALSVMKRDELSDEMGKQAILTFEREFYLKLNKEIQRLNDG